MITLVYGGSASGKSSFAEQAVMELLPQGPKYYIATMQAYGEEGKQRVKRHVKLREGKGFQTIECPVDITASLKQIREPAEAAILIECVSNLAANEMFDRPEGADAGQLVTKISTQLRDLCFQVKHAVIVTNNIFEDGVTYAPETRAYMRCLGEINHFLARMADQVIEVTAGKPVRLESPPASFSPGADRSLENAGDCDETKGARQIMRLVIGGTAQGKKAYVTRQLERRNLKYCVIEGNEPEGIEVPEDVQVLILDHLHLLIRRFGAEEAAMDYLHKIMDLCRVSGKELIIISDEVGNGVIPLEKEERDYREHVGRIVCCLAQEASLVERVVCGLAQKLS